MKKEQSESDIDSSEPEDKTNEIGEVELSNLEVVP